MVSLKRNTKIPLSNHIPIVFSDGACFSPDNKALECKLCGDECILPSVAEHCYQASNESCHNKKTKRNRECHCENRICLLLIFTCKAGYSIAKSTHQLFIWAEFSYHKVLVEMLHSELIQQCCWLPLGRRNADSLWGQSAGWCIAYLPH